MRATIETRFRDSATAFADIKIGLPFVHDGGLCIKIQSSGASYANIQTGHCGSLDGERLVKEVKYELRYMIR